MPTAPRKPGRPPMPLDRIVDAAIQLVDERGADTLTLRALADRLGSGTATLYRRVGGRTDLVALVVDRMLGDVDQAKIDAQPDWESVCRTVATEVYTALAGHGRGAPLLTESFPAGPNALALREKVAHALLAAGFDRPTTALTVASLGRYVVGFAMQANASQPTTAELRGAIDPREYPHLGALGANLPQGITDEFDFGLSMLLRGLRATAP